MNTQKLQQYNVGEIEIGLTTDVIKDKYQPKVIMKAKLHSFSFNFVRIFIS